MNTIAMRKLTMADVEDLHPRLRHEDQEECIVLGSNPREALIMGSFDNMMSYSRGAAYALVKDDIVIGAIGFTSSGFLWALSTKFSLATLRELWRRTPEITQFLLAMAIRRGVFPLGQPIYFQNVVHTRNKTALRWLQRSGLFRVFHEEPVEVGAEVFYPFRTLLPYEMAH